MGEDDKVVDVTAPPVLGISRPRHRDESKQLEASRQAGKQASTKTWREPHSSTAATLSSNAEVCRVGLKFEYVTRKLSVFEAALSLR